ncbi:hypothetical protein CJJ23_00410 [Mycoplasmopsis agassizii]|uniref:Probable multidrug resistance protein NorM n=1 Tax=Mycoplasmopsis agassizii TaxID=33922 RepID=A0A269TK48_9BACT|nr:MATE family efflux transporter [Mycoplasmopsis agassizii]PAK21794.1 hypothetical protein CJJ23_00410 [Mycoplasmopsis agassizii]
MKNTKKFLREHFPDSWSTTKLYTKIAVPVIIAAILFALNNFIDNFMVTTIDGGVAALSIANVYTALLTSVYVAISFISVSAFAQFYGKKDYKKARDTMKFRFMSAFIFAVIWTVIALIFPRQLVQLVSPGEREEVVVLAIEYIRYITIAWVLLSASFTYGSALREMGYGKLQMYNSIIILATNIIFNSIFIFALNMGVVGAAAASAIARVVAVLTNWGVMFWKNKHVIFNPIRLFVIDRHIWHIMKFRVLGGFLIAISQMTINLRTMLWNYGYPAGSVGSAQFNLSAASIIGITGSITAVFLSAINSINATTSVLVSQELGRNNIDVAKVNSRQLKGYNFVLGLVSASLLGLIVIILPYLGFLVRGQVENQRTINGDVAANLIQTQMLSEMQYTLLPIVFLMPTWLWFISSSNAIQSGKKNTLLSYVDFTANILQFIWLVIVNVVLARFFPDKLWLAVLVFYLSDIPKIFPYEYAYYKWNWATNITLDDKKTKVEKLKNEI